MIFTKKRSNSLSRRQLFAGAAAVAILPALPAFAFSEDAARALIDKAVGEINKIINSGSSEASMLRSFEGVFARYADAPRIGQLVLGVDGRSASAAQKRAFAKAFQTYMARKYGRRFREFIGGRIEVQSAKAVKSFYEVKSLAFLQGSQPFNVDWVVADASGKFIDLKIEGISLVKTERAEIGAMLDKRGGNLDQLIQDIVKI